MTTRTATFVVRSRRQLRAGALRVLGFVWLVAGAVPGVAQVTADLDDFPVFSLGFDGYPDANPKAPPAQSPDLKTRIVHSSIEAALPWRKSAASLFIGRASFDLVRFDMRDNQLPWTPKDLYDIGLEASWERALTSSWWLRAAARPHLASDLKNWGNDHIQMDAAVLLSGGHRGRGRYGIGATFSGIFGERLLLPVVELGWSRRDEVLRFDALLPERAAFLYRPKESLQVGLRGQVEGNRYRVGEAVDFPAGTRLAEPAVRYSVFTLGPVLHTALSQSAHLTLETGAALFRRLEVVDGDADVLDLDLTRDLEIKLGLEIRI